MKKGVSESCNAIEVLNILYIIRKKLMLVCSLKLEYEFVKP